MAVAEIEEEMAKAKHYCRARGWEISIVNGPD
jgi:hypothetical protein